MKPDTDLEKQTPGKLFLGSYLRVHCRHTRHEDDDGSSIGYPIQGENPEYILQSV